MMMENREESSAADQLKNTLLPFRPDLNSTYPVIRRYLLGPHPTSRMLSLAFGLVALHCLTLIACSKVHNPLLNSSTRGELVYSETFSFLSNLLYTFLYNLPVLVGFLAGGWVRRKGKEEALPDELLSLPLSDADILRSHIRLFALWALACFVIDRISIPFSFEFYVWNLGFGFSEPYPYWRSLIESRFAFTYTHPSSLSGSAAPFITYIVEALCQLITFLRFVVVAFISLAVVVSVRRPTLIVPAIAVLISYLLSQISFLAIATNIARQPEVEEAMNMIAGKGGTLLFLDLVYNSSILLALLVVATLLTPPLRSTILAMYRSPSR